MSYNWVGLIASHLLPKCFSSFAVHRVKIFGLHCLVLLGEVCLGCTSRLFRVPTLLVTKISRTFQDPEAFFQNPVIRQRCLNINTDSSYYGVLGGAPAASDFLYIQIKSKRIFTNVGICTCIIVSASHIIA